jgi:hypothetical protein
MHYNLFRTVRFEWAAEVGSIAVFKEPTDEDKICQVLKAFMEEWGTENVVVSLPRDWQQYSRIENIAGVRFEFCTEASIAIRVQCDNVVAAHYECELSC